MQNGFQIMLDVDWVKIYEWCLAQFYKYHIHMDKVYQLCDFSTFKMILAVQKAL